MGLNVPRGSRKDVRNAVKIARKAQAGWAKKTAYNRGQILYRAAEALESRAGEFGGDAGEAVDVLVHYAGWTDKLHAVLGTINPVAAPFLSMSTPEPTGVVAVLCGAEDSLAPLVSAIAAPLATGNVVVVALPERAPLPGLDLGEVLGVSDVSGGVVNLLSGRTEELVPALAAHRDVNAIIDATGDPELAVAIDTFAAETLKRVRSRRAHSLPPAPRSADRAPHRLAPDRRLESPYRARTLRVLLLSKPSHGHRDLVGDAAL